MKPVFMQPELAERVRIAILKHLSEEKEVAHVYRIIQEIVSEEPIPDKELEAAVKDAHAYWSGVVLPDSEIEYEKDSIVVHMHEHKLRDGYCRVDYELCQKEVLDPDEDCL